MNKNSVRSSFSKHLLTWFAKEKRVLSFRKTKEPYLVWVSEVILQQTQMETGIKFYEKFVKTFPNVRSLAKASEKEVYSLWQGLGYYNRAKNLHKTAKIVSKNKGVFPKKYKELIKLPGVGKYTASAIASICYNEKKYVVDANVYRVLSRVFGIKKNISKPKTYTEFEKLSSSLATNVEKTGDYNEAIMDFGGSVCLPKKPNCPSCIFKDMCVAYKKSLVEVLPIKTQTKKIKKRLFNYFVFENKNYFLLNKRKEKDIWKNLFEFYLIEGEYSKKTIETIYNKINKKLPKPIKTKSIAILSHQKIDVVFYSFFIVKKDTLIMVNNKLKMKMIKKSKVKNFGFPKVIDNYLNYHS